MHENGHLNGSQEGGEKRNFWTLTVEFSGFLILGSVEGGEGRNCCVLSPLGLQPFLDCTMLHKARGLEIGIM